MKARVIVWLIVVLGPTLGCRTAIPTASAPATPVAPVATFERLIGKGQVSQVAWSPDGTRLAVGTSVGIYLYDAETMRELRFMATEATVRSIAFGPRSGNDSDQSILASGGLGGTVQLWNAYTGERLRTLVGDRYYVNVVAFAPDGHLLAAAGHDGVVRLFDMDSGDLVRTLVGHEDQVFGLAFSSDGKRIISSSLDGTVRSWDLKSGDQLWLSGQRGKPTGAIALSPDDRLVAVATSYPGSVRLLDIRTGTVLQALEQGREVHSLAFAPTTSSTMFLAGGDGSKIRIWDVSTGRLVRTLDGHWRGRVSVAYGPDGARLASGSEDSTVRLWDPSTGQSLYGQELTCNVMGVFSTTTSLLALGGGIERVWLWDVLTGNVLQEFRLPSPRLATFILSSDGTILAGATYEGPIWIWRTNSGQLLHALDRMNFPNSISLSPNGQVLVIGEGDHLSLWDVDSGNLIRTIQGDSCGFGSLLFSPDGQLLASGFACLVDPPSDRFMRLWNTRTGELVYKMEKGSVPIAFDADGQTIAAVGEKGAIQLWDVRTGRLVRALQGQLSMATSGAFISFQKKDSPGNSLLALGGWDNMVRLWDTSAGRVLQTLTGHTAEISHVVFSPDGHLLATRSTDGTARLWRMTPHE